MTVDVHLLGIRHHGPGSARSVLRALDELRPATVLVELPSDTTDALAWIGRPGLVPPVALLGYDPAPGRAATAAAFFPLAEFSPEWQAIAWANAHGVPVAAIDRPVKLLLADDAVGVTQPAARRALVDPIGELATAAGEPDAERWWEDVVEHRGGGLAAFEAVAEAMSAVREGAVAAGYVPDPQTTRREAAMRTAIRAARAEVANRPEGDEAAERPIAVVCGAWHVPALDVDDAAHRATADRTLATSALSGEGRARAVKAAVAWVPWTNGRLATASGYAAGVEHPGWYHHVFAHPGRTGTGEFLVTAARAIRAAGRAVSVDHVIAATQLADHLAVLRDRPQPGLAEVLDASDAVYASRDLVLQRLVVGNDVGEVPPDAPQVPLAADVAAQQRACRLKPEADPRQLELDLRTPNGRRRSHLLHRLTALGVPWGTVIEGRGSSGSFRETWELRWEPEWSVRLIERAGLGVTVEEAATAALTERASRAGRIAEATAVVDLALLADLSDVVRPALDVISRLAAAAPDVADLIDALGPLANAARYGDVRGTDSTALGAVFDELVVRVLAGLDAAVIGLDEDAAAAMADRLTSLHGALGIVDHAARHEPLQAVLERIADGRGVHGLVQGRTSRLLHDGGAWGPDELRRRLGRALGPGSQPAGAAAFVEGLLAGSGTILLHDAALLSGVDAWLASLTPDSFTTTVPLLRRTFGAFEPAERRRLGALVASGQATGAPTIGADVDEERAALAIATVRRLLGLAPAERPRLRQGCASL